jgi:hypothetical protein
MGRNWEFWKFGEVRTHLKNETDILNCLSEVTEEALRVWLIIYCFTSR